MWYIHMVEYYSIVEKDDIMKFEGKGMELGKKSSSTNGEGKAGWPPTEGSNSTRIYDFAHS